VVGDKIYGPDETIFIRFTEGRLTKQDQDRLRLSRHALHAAEVRFEHPVTRHQLHLLSPLPSELAGFLSQLDEVV